MKRQVGEGDEEHFELRLSIHLPTPRAGGHEIAAVQLTAVTRDPLGQLLVYVPNEERLEADLQGDVP
jgi:hypothetical protein